MRFCKWTFLIFLLVLAVTVTPQSPTLVLQKGHFASIKSIAFSKNGRQVVTTAGDGTLKIWDPFSHRLLQELDGGGYSFSTAEFSGNDKYIIAPYNTEDDSHAGVNIWATETGALQQKSINGSVSPNGEWRIEHKPPLFQTRQDFSEQAVQKYPINIYSTTTGKIVRCVNRFINKEDDPFLISFISDSCLLLAQKSRLTSGRGNITRYHVYNFMKDDEPLVFSDTSFKPKGSEILISNTGKYFLRTVNRITDISDPHAEFTNADSMYTELWNIAEGRLMMRTHAVIADAIFSDDDASLAFAYDVVWDTHPAANDLDWPPYGRVDWISIRNKSRRIFQAGNWVENTVPVFSKNGRYMAVAVLDTATLNGQDVFPVERGYNIKLYDESGALYNVCRVKKKPAAMVFDPSGKYIVVGFVDGNFGVWELSGRPATEITAVQNEVDPLLNMHMDDTTDEIFYTTRNMYGKQAAHTFNGIRSISTDSLRIFQHHFILNGKYSLLMQRPDDGYAGRLVLVNNDSPSIIKIIPYSWGKNVAMFMHSLSADTSLHSAGTDRVTTLLHDKELQSLSIYATSADSTSVNPLWRSGKLLLPTGFIFAIVQSRRAADTVMLLSTFGNFVLNKKLKGYTYNGNGNYLVTVRDVKVKTLSKIVKVMMPVLSNDGNSLIGPKANDEYEFKLMDFLKKDPRISSNNFLYCLDLANNLKFRTPIGFKKDSIVIPNRFVFAPDGKTAIILGESYYAASGFVRVINATNGNPLYNLHINNSNSITGAAYTKDSRFLYAWSASGFCVKWDLTTGKEIYSMVFFDDHDYAIILPNGYYYISSKTDARLLNFKYNNKFYNFSQFDLQFNRPDKVLQAIGSCDKALIGEYRKAWLNRVGKAGFNEKDVNNQSLHVPEVNLPADNIPGNSQQNELKLTVNFKDSLFSIHSYNFFINDVPLLGINGTVVANPVKQLQVTQSLLLSQGRNRIEVACTNEKGVESRRETIYTNYQPIQATAGKTYFIGIGINQYSRQSSFVDLSYCVKDIRDLSAAFREKYKEEVVIDTLMNDNASKENILALKEKLMHTQVDDKVIISFSGHGMVDPQHPEDFYFATGKTQVNNPAANGLSYAQLEELLDSIPARKKIMLLDACHSGESNDNAVVGFSNIPGTKKRGVDEKNDDAERKDAGSIEILDVVENAGASRSATTDIFKLMKEAFVDIRRNNGAYVLSAAQSNEAAGEGGGIFNGWFSSCLIEQLHQPGNMTVNELSINVNKCVSAKSGGNQNTDNRQELAEFNWQLW